MTATRKSSSVITAAVLLLLPLIYFFPAVTGRVIFAMGDAWAYSLPMRVLTGEMLRRGTLPLWNPHVFAGMPLLATVQPGVLYPPNWLFAILSPGAAMNAVTIITYHLSLCGTFLFARALSLGRLAALIAAVIFTFGGFMISHPEMTNYIAAAAWLPWILLATEKISRSRSWRESWRWVMAGALMIALQCYAGLPQATWQTILICGPYFLFSLVEPGKALSTKSHETARSEEMSVFRFVNLRVASWRKFLLAERRSEDSFIPLRRYVLSVVLMGAGGLLLSAVQLLPTIELQQQGERAAIPYEAFAAYPLAPRFLLTLIVPYFYGGGWPPLYHAGGWDEWWLLRYGYGYVGLSGLLLALAAWFVPGRSKRQSQVWFWTLTGAAALLLSFGDYLPFGLNHLLYRVPVFNLFRASYRHLLEFTFAAAMLAGFGLEGLSRLKRDSATRALIRSSLVLLMLLIVVTLIFLFFTAKLGAPVTPQRTSITNAEILVPWLMCGLCVAGTLIYVQRQSALAGAALIIVVLVDLASFGWFTYWRSVDYSIVSRLQDSAAVREIKAREPALHSFRVISQATWPFGENYAAIGHANLAGVSGLQGVTGYDPLYLQRSATMAGNLDMFAMMRDSQATGPEDQRLNLLNVKYLVRERSSLKDERINRVERNGEIYYDGIFSELRLGSGISLDLEADGAGASELELISAAFGVAHYTDGTPIASIRLHTRDGRVLEREMQAGRDTAEWAFERSDIGQSIRHHRAPVIQSWQASSEQGSFIAHRYLTRFSFERAAIDYVELKYLLPDGALTMQRARLVDRTTGTETPLDRQRLSPERWKLIGPCGEAELYENLKAMPRAWFVSETLNLSDAAILQTITSGRLPDGRQFDPAQMALVESNISLPQADIVGGKVRITRSEPQRIELQTSNHQPGFLVLSEIDFRGWEARVDGVQTPIHRTDYALRGISVPAGQHRIEFVYRPLSFRVGMIAAISGVIFLIGGQVLVWSMKSFQTQRDKEHKEGTG
ncbi:MAG: YfhO family protein [Blastocatellia bacterium]